MFKVMSWNVENLFRPFTETGPDSSAVYEAKLEGLAPRSTRRPRTRLQSRRSASLRHSAIWSICWMEAGTGGSRSIRISAASAWRG